MSETKPSETKPKKMVSRNVAVALGIVCILLITSLGGAMAYYTMTINNKDSNYNEYLSTHHYPDSNYNSLNSTYYNYTGSHTHGDSDYNGLNSTYYNYMGNYTYSDSEVAASLAPFLIKVNLLSDDNIPLLGEPYLHVHGEECNVGSHTAYNCKLHVTAYQSGGVVAIDTDIVLGTIDGRSWISVDASPTYSGGSLTTWTIAQQWTASP